MYHRSGHLKHYGLGFSEIIKTKYQLFVDTCNDYLEIPQLESFGFQDSFEQMNVAPPMSTSWAGRRIDFIFSRKMVPEACYIYHSDASEHHAVVCDFVKT